MTFTGPDDVVRQFDAQDYLLDTGTASAIYLAVTLGRPLLLEGEPGVGKTTAAKTLAAVLNTALVRLQCYVGLTAGEALYDWNYQRQLLSIRLAEPRGQGSPNISEADLHTETYLVDRPILQCVRHRRPGVARRGGPRRRVRGRGVGQPGGARQDAGRPYPDSRRVY
jgi:MoxR-like ATPase